MARDGGKKSNCVGSPLFQAFREFVLDRGRYWDTRNVFGQIGNNKNDNRKRVGKEKLPDWLPFPVKTQKYGLMFEESVRRIFFAGITRGGPRSWSAAKRMMDRTIVVTFARRQSSTLHGYLDEGGVFGLQLHGVDGTDVKPPKDFVEGSEPKLKRIVKNEATLIEMLRNETKNWEKESTVPVEFRAVDFAAISFDDQLAISRGTDLFVGPHGASFAWTMYLRRLPVAGVLELKPPERGVGNQQFQNMAKRYGYGYQFVPIGPTVSGEQMDRIVSSMRILLDDIHRGRITLAE
ncbi:hypothetical protein BDR26DRAFT_875066 [Obelidium mucronatum]|nr:hypothetical protein BDR26DRAFT_875066 [Obelidium mucronatum]